MDLNRRSLLASSVCLAATALPGLALAQPGANVLRTDMISLPFVDSYREYKEWRMSEDGRSIATEKTFGWMHSPLPRTSQIMTVVDKALLNLKGQVFTVQLSLRDIDGNLIGQATEAFKAFRKNGEAIGWFGAGEAMKAAGLHVHGNERLDTIGYVKVQCLIPGRA